MGEIEREFSRGAGCDSPIVPGRFEAFWPDPSACPSSLAEGLASPLHVAVFQMERADRICGAAQTHAQARNGSPCGRPTGPPP